MLNKLDSILLSDEVTKNFYTEYSNPEFRDWLNSFLPEVEKCRRQQQDNPWHIYNCLDHILKSVEAINKQTTALDFDQRRKLAYTMFLHDIGKPDKYIRRYSKLYKREVDSFFNHNLQSKEIADRVLTTHLGFSRQDSEEIKTLVEQHDMFMFLTLENDYNPHHKVLTPHYLKQVEQELDQNFDGHDMLTKLTMVGRADNMAQNPEMTQDSLRLVDKMEKMLSEKTQEENPVQ